LLRLMLVVMNVLVVLPLVDSRTVDECEIIYYSDRWLPPK